MSDSTCDISVRETRSAPGCPTCAITVDLVNSPVEETWKDLVPLLRGNIHLSTLSTSQIGTITELTSRFRKDFQRYDAEVIRLEHLITQLKIKRKSFKDQFEGYSSLHSPIRMLPPEVLRQIFLFVCNDNIIESRDIDSNCTIDFPAIAVSQACNFWRALALSTPELWSTITAKTTGNMVLSPKATLGIKYLLERSKSAPLHVGYVNGTHRMTRKTSHFGEMNLLIGHSERWASLILAVEACTLGSSNFPTFPGNLPNLKFLRIDSASDDDTVQFGPCHNLAFLELSSIFPSQVDISWSQLTRLNIAYSPPLPVLRHLADCTSLVDLCIEACGSDDPEYGEGPTSLPTTCHATKFSLAFEKDNNDQKVLFHGLHMPSLRELRLFTWTGKTDDCQTPCRELCSFLSSSAAGLTELIIDDVPLSSIELLSVLRLVPTLTNFYFYEQGFADVSRSAISDQLLEKLEVKQPDLSDAHIPGSTQGFLPQLTVMELIATGRSFSDQAFTDMVRSRSPGVQNVGSTVLKSVYMKVSARTIDAASVVMLRQSLGSRAVIELWDKDGLVFGS